MAIDKLSKSNRLLQSRRYTHDSYTDTQEAFTSTLDINANEVYVDQGLIPSTGLPFSGSAQSGSIYSVNGQSVMQYYYRAGLTRSDLSTGSKSEVWFLLSNSSASAAGIGGQLIDGNQQTNFISPKYGAVSLANANAEDATPGYGVKVFVSSATTAAGVVAGDQVSTNNYTFDYKTGVLQFTTTALAPTTSQYVYISGYQYKGRVLTDSITNVSASIVALSASVGGGGGGSLSSRVDQLAAATASVNSFTSSALTRLTGLEGETTNLETFSSSTLTRLSRIEESTSSLNTFSASINTKLSTLGNLTGSYATTGSNTFQGTQIITGSLYISQDLIVGGSSSIQNISASRLDIGDNIIELNTAQPSLRFGGIAVADSGSSPRVSGSLLFDSQDNEWVFVHQAISGAAVTSSIVITGPETYNSLGNETRLTTNRIPKSTNGFHIVDSNISDNGSAVSINSNTQVTGSLNIKDSAATFSIVGNGFSETYLQSNGGMLLQAGGGGVQIKSNSLSVDNNLTVGGDISGSTINGLGNATAYSQSVSASIASVVANVGSGVGISITNLNSFSASAINSLNSLNAFSGSQLTKDSTLANYTASIDSKFATISNVTSSIDNKFVNLQSYTASIDTKFGTLATYTASTDGRLTNLETTSASVNTLNTLQTTRIDQLAAATASVNSYTSSVNGHVTDINTWSASVKGHITDINTFTASLTTTYEGRASAAKTIFSGSSQVSFVGLSNIPGNIVSASTNSTNVAIIISTGSISANLIGGVVSGSSQITYGNLTGIPTNIISGASDSNNIDFTITNGIITADLKGGVVSGSSQIMAGSTTNFATDVKTQLNSSAVISGSVQVDVTQTTNWATGVKTQLNNNTVISGSSQVTGIGNSQLSNSSITIAGQSTALGSSISADTIRAAIGTVVTGSSQIDITSTTNFATYSGSVSASIASVVANVGSGVGISITNLNAFSASQLTKDSTIASYTSSVDSKFSTLQTLTASIAAQVLRIQESTASLNAYTQSNDTTNTTQNNRLSRLEESTASLNLYTSSQDTKNSALGLYTASVDSKFTIVQSITASFNTATASLNLYTASAVTQSLGYNTYTSSIDSKFSTLATYTASVDAKFTNIQSSTASLNVYTASAISQSLGYNAYTASAVTQSLGYNAFTASENSKSATLATYTASVDSKFANIQASTASLNAFTSSQEAKNTTLQTLTASMAAQVLRIQESTASLNLFTASAGLRLTNLETTSASVNTSISGLNSYTTSLRAAITASGVDITVNGNTTIKGNLYVQGTQTVVDSTTINIADNVLVLNAAGTSDGGIIVKDATGASTISGSLLWDVTNDYWKAGKSGSESKVALMGGDNVVTASSQILFTGIQGYDTYSSSVATSISASNATITLVSQSLGGGTTGNRLSRLEESTASLNTFSASTLTRLSRIEESTASLNAYTASAISQSLGYNSYTSSAISQSLGYNAFTASENSKSATLAIYTASLDNKNSTLALYTASVDSKFTTLQTLTASVAAQVSRLQESTASLNTFSASVLGHIADINSKTGSYATINGNSFNGSQLITGSLSVSQNITGSASASFVSLAVNTLTPTQKIHLKGAVGIENGTTAGNLADQIVFGYNGSGLTSYTHKIQTSHDAQAQLNKMDFQLANAASTWKTPLQLRHDRVITSGSAYITGDLIVTGSINGLINATNGVVSGSSQIDITSTTNYTTFSGSIASSISASVAGATWTNISGKPAGLVSGSSQIVLNDANKTGFDTTDVAEGSNLYYTDGRVQAVVTQAYIQTTLTTIDGGTY